MSKMIAVIGPEASGSRLIAQTIALWEGVINNPFDWDGTLSVEHHGTTIFHRSIPSGPDKNIVDIADLYNQNPNLKIVFTTRDKNISRISRNNTEEEHLLWIEQNEIAICDAKTLKIPYMFFSYETYMLYKELYLAELYKFLDYPDFYYKETPILFDGNRKYLK